MSGYKSIMKKMLCGNQYLSVEQSEEDKINTNREVLSILYGL